MAEQVKKMVLVPAEMAARPRPVEGHLTELDHQMQEILHNNQLPSDVKVKLYSHVLGQHGEAKAEAAKPLQMPINESAPVEKIPKYLVEEAPKSSRGAAQAMHRFINEVEGIEFDPIGQLVVDGQPIAGSSKDDLFNYATRNLKRQPPRGWDPFLERLQEYNVPYGAVLNSRARAALFPATPPPDPAILEAAAGTIHGTPRKAPPRPRKQRGKGIKRMYGYTAW